MMRTIMSSGMSPPLFMIGSTSRPSSEPAATSSRSIWPVLTWGMPKRSEMIVACVPLPLPGGPKRTVIT